MRVFSQLQPAYAAPARTSVSAPPAECPSLRDSAHLPHFANSAFYFYSLLKKASNREYHGGRMSIDQITAEQEALQSLVKLLEQARRCQMLYERAHMSFPEPLKRVLGMSSASGTMSQASSTNLTIPPPDPPPTPQIAKSDWIWIKREDATPTTVALAVLRGAKSPMRARDVVGQVTEILPNVPRGSVNNIGTRLSGTQIERTDEGWRLTNQDSGAVIFEGHLWGPPAIFHKVELAVHRRCAILHLLSFFPGGLQPRQILEQLRRCTWVHAPVNKDLLKADLEILEKEKKIRKVGNSGKWELTKEQKDA